MIFTTVYNGAFSIASKNDLDDQNLLLATVLSYVCHTDLRLHLDASKFMSEVRSVDK
jgi:hypothetical protein